MTLAFSQAINGKPNYFVEKILSCDEFLKMEIDEQFLSTAHHPDININLVTEWPAKIHTIREDSGDRWKAGRPIHFVIKNRTKDRFQFAPIVNCQGVQGISIIYPNDEDTELLHSEKGKPYVYLKHWSDMDGEYESEYMPFYYTHADGSSYGLEDMKALAINDGFNSIEDFFKYFNKDFTGKIIHWTPKKY